LFGLYMICHYLFKPHSYAKNKNNWVVKKSCWLSQRNPVSYTQDEIVRFCPVWDWWG
jgi:hypothetical protein